MPNLGILHTKLYRPPLSGDLIVREHLLDRLESRRRQRALTLVSAPAGYGKSTLICQWLDAHEYPSAWLSLDEDDSDLRQFLRYVTAALQSLAPDFGQKTRALLNSLELPSWKVLAQILLKELEELRESCILVLDDSHRLHNPEIHDLLRELLSHPLPTLQLVLIARHDPPLPLARLRASNRLTEIREPELRFSPAETRAFLEQVTGLPVNERTVATLDDKLEGWVTGLRLATLSLHDGQDAERFVAHLPEKNQHITDYLFEEVFARQPEMIRRCLLLTSILDRFCAPLCEALCQDPDQDQPLRDGQGFLNSLMQQGLFVLILDRQQSWFRYHHMFQAFLQRRLQLSVSPHRRVELHRRASQWFASQHLLDEALRHAFAAEDLPAAIQLVAQHRHRLMNEEQWPRLVSLLALFPTEAVERSPELLIIKAWLAQHRNHIEEISAMLDQLKAIQSARPGDMSYARCLRGEYAVLRSYPEFIAGHVDEMYALARRAMNILPENALYARGLGLRMLSLAFQMHGEFDRATATVHQALQPSVFRRTNHHTRLLITLCIVHWVDADLSSVEQIATQTLHLSQESRQEESLCYARYFLGECHYQRNHLADAQRLLLAAIHPDEMLTSRNSVLSNVVLAFTHLAQGESSAAHDISDRLVTVALKDGHTLLLHYLQLFNAELMLRQGHLDEAIAGIQQASPLPLIPFTHAFLPHLTPVKAFIAQASPESLQKATNLLAQVREFYERIHHRRFLIEILAIQALLNEAQGDRGAALASLQQALRLAKPCGYLRLFTDLGAGMESLLQHCRRQKVMPAYTARLLDTFPHEAERPTPDVRAAQQEQAGLIEPLSKRELEIFELLVQRFGNREIAERLFISPRTVKTHLYHIYQKLNVHGRREAVAKARELDLLARR